MVISRTDASDQQLIILSQKGDQLAFREIVNRYRSRVAATVIGMLGHTPEAEDAGQETFIRLYRGLGQFRGDASLGTYLTRIAINVALNEIKRQKKRGEFLHDRTIEDLQIADQNSEAPADSSKEIIRRGLQHLEPEFRAVILLRIFEGFTTQDTATILDIPVGTVLSRLSRAQKKLREVIEPFFLGEK